MFIGVRMNKLKILRLMQSSSFGMRVIGVNYNLVIVLCHISATFFYNTKGFNFTEKIVDAVNFP